MFQINKQIIIMKKLLLPTMFLLMIGSLNAQTILNQTYDGTYAASTANGKTVWTGNMVLLQTNLESGYGFSNPGYVATSPLFYAASGFKFTLGSPNNENAPDGTAQWLTYTATGLEVGKSYDVSAVVNCFQTNTSTDYALAIWEGASVPNKSYVNANRKAFTTGAAEGDKTLSGIYVATATTMTFGIGSAKTATGTLFSKLQVKSWSISKNNTLSLNDKELTKTEIIVSKEGVVLTDLPGTIHIYDVQGRLLTSGTVKANEKLGYDFSVATIYLVKVTTSVGTATKKVLF